MKVKSSTAPDKRATDPSPRWPSFAWANAFAIQEQHDLDVMRIETEAYAAVGRKLQRGGSL